MKLASAANFLKVTMSFVVQRTTHRAARGERGAVPEALWVFRKTPGRAHTEEQDFCRELVSKKFSLVVTGEVEPRGEQDEYPSGGGGATGDKF